MSDASQDRTAAVPHERDEAAEALHQFRFVGVQPKADLTRFVALLRQWQQTHNLVSRSSLEGIWSRHVADSLQLLRHAPDFRRWVDLGSGAGFPGLVVAIASKDQPERHVTLVEANHKKAAFLRAAIRETGAPASVVAERIEAFAPGTAAADVVSARALAPVADLLRLGAHLLGPGSVMLLLKGQDFVQELEAASKYWDFDVLDSASVTDAGGRVLAIRNIRQRGPRP